MKATPFLTMPVASASVAPPSAAKAGSADRVVNTANRPAARVAVVLRMGLSGLVEDGRMMDVFVLERKAEKAAGQAAFLQLDRVGALFELRTRSTRRRRWCSAPERPRLRRGARGQE